MKTTNRQIQAFNFQAEAVRVVNQGNDPWFVALDVCRILGIVNHKDAIAELDDDEKGVAITDSLGGPQRANIISESGLYALIFKSRKPEAKAFRKWVTSEVLPSIRQTGEYKVKEDRYINLIDEQVARGVKPLPAAKLAYKICFQEPKQPEPESPKPSKFDSLTLRFTGTAAEILRELQRKGTPGRSHETVTTLSATLRRMARGGDPRVTIEPNLTLSKRALRFTVRFEGGLGGARGVWFFPNPPM